METNFPKNSADFPTRMSQQLSLVHHVLSRGQRISRRKKSSKGMVLQHYLPVLIVLRRSGHIIMQSPPALHMVLHHELRSGSDDVPIIEAV